MADMEELQSVAEKSLHLPANADLLAYCPSMELLAVGSSDQNVSIYRLNGQRVFGTSQKLKGAVLEVQKLIWKPNGMAQLAPPLMPTLTLRPRPITRHCLE